MATACHSGETNRRLGLQPVMCIHDPCIYILHLCKYDIWLKYGDLKQTNLTLSWWFLFAVDFQGKWGTGIPNWMARSRTIVLVESFISTSVWRPGRVPPCDPFFPTYE